MASSFKLFLEEDLPGRTGWFSRIFGQVHTVTWWIEETYENGSKRKHSRSIVYRRGEGKAWAVAEMDGKRMLDEYRASEAYRQRADEYKNRTRKVIS